MRNSDDQPANPFLRRFFLLFVVVTTTTTVHATATTTSPQPLRCQSESGQMIVIPTNQINDGYCDCPYDGVDEPSTDACAGSTHWPGILPPPKKENKDNDIGQHKEPLYFTCPQQPDLQLPMSRLDDGICDCCDGADEQPQLGEGGRCPDNCQDVLRAQREAFEQASASYQKGHAQLQQELQKFKTHTKITKSKINSLQTRSQQHQDELDNVLHAQILDMEWTYLQQRFQTAQEFQFLLNLDNDNNHVLSKEELETLIVATCQLTGELSPAKKMEECGALRLAGLDHGIVWNTQNSPEEEHTSTTVEFLISSSPPRKDEKMVQLAKLLIRNTKNPQNPQWALKEDEKKEENTSQKKHNNHHRSRHHEYHDDDEEDDEYYGDDDDDYHDYHEDHEDEVGYDDFYEDDSSEHSGSDENGGSDQSLLDKVLESPLSTLRVPFLQQSKLLLDQITDFENYSQQQQQQQDDDENEDTSNEEHEKSDEDSSTEDSTPPTTLFDPMAYQMVRSKLEKTQRSIERGIKSASSAKGLLASLNNNNNNSNNNHDLLSSLAKSTLYYSKLSTVDVYQLIVGILPEFDDQESCSSQEDPQQCLEQQQQTPRALLCPLQTLNRKGQEGGVFPPIEIMPLLEEFCTNMDQESLDWSSSSSKEDDTTTTTTTTTTTPPPTHISDCFGGYVEPQQRTAEQDPFLSKIYSVMEDAIELPPQLVELETQQDTLIKTQNELKSQLQTLQKDIDEQKYGPGGLLWSMKDQCFDVEAGKYTYEVCMMGKATQRDRGQKSGGTNLGQWDGMTIHPTGEEEDHEFAIEMNWKHGAKCWNGPERSAQVWVTCGAETKVLSADEPQTCTYVLEMESYIACNDAYKQKHGL